MSIRSEIRRDPVGIACILISLVWGVIWGVALNLVLG
jgi:hypothetical protein